MANAMLTDPRYYEQKMTASGRLHNAGSVVSICQWYISLKKIVLTSFENANTYNIIVNYISKNLIRSFVRSCSPRH